MKRIISIRELALLAVLIVLAAYYFVVQGPVAKQTAELNTSSIELQNEINAAMQQAVVMNRMQSELESIYSDEGGVRHLLSDYSNNKVLLQELNVVLNAADEFDASFGDVSFSDNIMRREISISFTTQTRGAAESIVSAIESSINAYLITGFSCSDSGSNGTWHSSLNLVNYEFVTDEQAAELGLTDGNGSETANMSATEEALNKLEK